MTLPSSKKLSRIRSWKDTCPIFSFSDKDGIIVLKNKVEKEVLDSYAAVRSGSITLDIKDVYIAEGAFCE